MMFLIWLIWILNIVTASGQVSSSPPVLIWGIKTPKIETIFRLVTNKQFYGLMKKIQKEHMIVMYLASELSAKDLNCEPCFPNLMLIKNMNYYSQVEEPLKALQRVSQKTNEIIWHKLLITNQTDLKLEMKMPCQPGRIHAFDFQDRNRLAHDYAMGVSNLQFDNCPVVQAYTALKEENLAYQRRKEQSIIIRTRKNESDMAPHLSFISTRSNNELIVLRCKQAILAFNRILLSYRETGKSPHMVRTNLTVRRNNQAMQVGTYKEPDDLSAGLVLVLDTAFSPIVIEVLPVKGNWYLTRVIINDTTFYPKDLIFFSDDFSLCCSEVNFFAWDKSLLSLTDFHLDIITSADKSGMLLQYQAKPCWSTSQFLTPTLAQTLIVMFLFVGIFSIGMVFITNIGRNELVQVAAEPDLYIKTDQ
ncbi:hypothetical protein KR059_012509 [Drosophila kikkawai]|nr:hypothetical protein KR059_012509 [Drosophila kikkawai]